MATNYQDLLDMLKPQEEEKLFSSIEPTSQQLISPINPTPEELAALSQQQAPVMEEVAEPVQAPVKNAAQPVLKKAPIEQSMESGDLGISKAMDAFKNWENRPKEEASSITQTQAPTTEAPMSKSEALIAEYNKLLGKGQEDLAEARRRDRMLKVGGSLGDALATYLNARSQMNVKAPGVQVQQGAGLGKIADMFATAPEIASDVAQRREAMMKQYAELAKGERSQARLTSEEQRAEKRMQQQERMAKAENETMLKAAGIRASRKEEKEKEKGLTPYQEMMREEKAKTRQEKDANILEELENRRTIVEQNVKRARDLIDKYGTVELFGSEAEQLNGIMQEIATDVAKLQDPKSVARPSEVESIRKTLIPESTSERMMLSNETAMDILDKFKERINERADIGYSVRGFDPKTKKPITQQSKTDTLIKIKAPSGAIREVSQQNAEEYLKRPGYSKVD